MKKFLFILSLSLLLSGSSTLPLSTLAAPAVSLSKTANNRYVILGFSDLRTVSKVSYTLTYDTSRSQTGFVGGFKVSPRTTRSTRRQILGTCSSGKCVYQTGTKNFKLEATFTLRSGGVTSVTKTLP